MMSGNELQFGLICLGVLAIVGVLAFNFYQERRARKHAEQAFRSTHHDVLLDEDSEPSIPPAPGGRMEPALPRQGGAEHASAAASPSPVTVKPAVVRPAMPELPADDHMIDCVVSIDAPAGVSCSALFAAQLEVMSGFARSLRWFGWDETSNAWVEIGAHTPGSISRAQVALQLADRQGCISANELERFYTQLQRVCDQFLAVPRLPQRAEVLHKAGELDKFCSDVDIQIAVNLVAGSTPFIGTKLRGLAEAAGMTLGGDGAYHQRDDAGNVQFSLTNLDPLPFSPEQLRHLQSHGVVLSLDIPRTINPAHTFDRMIAFAQHLANALDGSLVDDNRVALSDRAISLIRNQIYQFELQMERQAIPAGSPMALRLFA